MTTMNTRMARFRRRVETAHSMYLTGQTEGRAFDNCFENYDGAIVVTALMRRASNDERLYRAIRRDFSGMSDSEWTWPRTANKYAHVKTHRLPSLAAQIQVEGEWMGIEFLRQMEIAKMPDAAVYGVTRTEGSNSYTQNVWGTSLRHVCQIIEGWNNRTIEGQPFLSLLASIVITPPDGETYKLR